MVNVETGRNTFNYVTDTLLEYYGNYTEYFRQTKYNQFL